MNQFYFIFGVFKKISVKEWIFFCISLFSILLSFYLGPEKDYITLASSILGLFGVFFVAKGAVIGQYFFVIFAIFYGIVAVKFRYFSEIITYIGMNLPISIVTIIQWSKNPFKNSSEVKVAVITKKLKAVMISSTLLVTYAFYFILKALDTKNLPVSTVSISTSWLANFLMLLRSPLYAIAFIANDIVLIVLWTMASIKDAVYVPMVICFVVFLLNDGYGFWYWKRMEYIQKDAE